MHCKVEKWQIMLDVQRKQIVIHQATVTIHCNHLYVKCITKIINYSGSLAPNNIRIMGSSHVLQNLFVPCSGHPGQYWFGSSDFPAVTMQALKRSTWKLGLHVHVCGRHRHWPPGISRMATRSFGRSLKDAFRQCVKELKVQEAENKLSHRSVYKIATILLSTRKL